MTLTTTFRYTFTLLRRNNVTKKTSFGDGGRREIRNGIPYEGKSGRNDSNKLEK
jgi:hypothetical protein